jgi:3-oxoadipate enol-lactonase
VVVFLHGLGGSRTAWDPQLLGLGHRFRCVAWDLPGYGRSRPLPTLTFSAIADAVAGLLDELGTDRAHLVGESFGGMHALHTAIRPPDRVDRLVLTNTSPAFGLDGTRADDWKRARLAPLDAGARPAEIAPTVLGAIAGPGLTGPAMAARVAAFGRIPADALRAAVHCLPDHDVRSELAAITAPALVIAGELDAETPVDYARVLVDGLVDARLEVLDGVGHLAASEDPGRFNRLVASFLGEFPPRHRNG